MSETVILLAPSHGLGGGIERYVSTIEASFQQEGVRYRRLDLRCSDRPRGLKAKAQFLREVRHVVRTSREPIRLVLAHRNLLPVVRIVAGLPAFTRATVILHGYEIWSNRHTRGASLMHRPEVRVVAVSNFSAGASACPATVLNPGVAADWYATLVDAGNRIRPTASTLSLVTTFRLDDWRDKGLDALLAAIRLLDDDRVRLTVCGSGLPSPELTATVKQHPWCRIAPNLTDQALAAQLAQADLFVLATRTRYGKNACGEGFGLVLLEAQLAGTCVVAPAYGGSGDAFQPDVTGLAPVDETPEALSAVLAELLHDDDRRAEMSRAAADWSRTRFEPTNYGRQVHRALLGCPPPARREPLSRASTQGETMTIHPAASGSA